jgi:hypothetical protein
MNASAFELHVSLPAEARFAHTMRDLAAHAARYAGCADADADRYGLAVEAMVVACADAATAGSAMPVTIVRRAAGPVEFLIVCEERVIAGEISDAHITIGWTRSANGHVCRVARMMPDASSV